MFEWDGDTKKLLSTLWIFLTVNYIYCDVFGMHDADTLQQLLSGEVGDIKITEEFLLYFAMIMQIPMIMIPLSRYLSYKINKYLNIVAATISGGIQSYTVYMGGTLFYLFFSFFEIATALLIIIMAIRWKPTATRERTENT
ncbi:DUF6326 family protein [Teredinibacter turnerae]|uniref:DUF6326 family protein n=1 Tax=Teredinibacter turnerae TaxID=2426 RepID=UPI00037B038F|nr:DUF6326 family protein [Teredinibacter turnerae]